MTAHSHALSSPESVGSRKKKARIDFSDEHQVIESPPHDPGVEASDAIELSIKEELERLSPFPVEFTHQLFEGEMIKWDAGGPDEGSVKIKIIYSSPGFSCFVDLEGVPACEEESLLVKLRRALPPNFTRSKETFLDDLRGFKISNLPQLSLIYEYECRYGMTYTLMRGKGGERGLKEYHDRVQGMAMWYIENSSSINVEDDRWDVYYLMMDCPTKGGYEEKSKLLVGFFTVFNFRNPLKGVSLRVCQALILPPEQRKGHARQFMQYIYDTARKSDSIFEVTVEDPAPSFTALRNMVDVQHCKNHNAFSEELIESEDWKPLPKADCESMSKELKITALQVEKAYELTRMSRVDPDDQETETKSRLMIKRRLFNMHQEELSTDPQQRKIQLADLYHEVELEFQPILERLRDDFY